MNDRKPSLWLITSILLIVLGVLALLPGASTRSALAQPPLVPDGPADMQAIAVTGDPISIEVDKDGYTTWTYDYSYNRESLPNFCWPYSRIRWPFDLGAQDPTELSETTLIFTFAEMKFAYNPNGPDYFDPTWAVALNGNPGMWVDGNFTGDWNIIGAIGTEPAESRFAERVVVEQEVPFDYTELIDGENNVWFQQQDFCDCDNPPDCACTCYELFSIKLRARVKLAVKDVWPEHGAENVWVGQSAGQTDPFQVRIAFTTLVSETMVNEDTFQMYYLNKQNEPVYAPGSIHKLSDLEYAFTPDPPLKDGVRYEARVWAKSDAEAEHHDHWVKDLSGGPLETGAYWSFWTLPEPLVKLEAVQVLENQPLVVYKPTALRVFLTSDNYHIDVRQEDMWKYVDVEDIELTWRSPSGSQDETVSWRAGGSGWDVDYTPDTARRYRLNDKFTRLASRDSVNYFDFVPNEADGYYWLRAAVTLLDSEGEPHRFVDLDTPNAVASPWLNIHARALAVGSDYGNTGTVDLSASLAGHRSGVQAIYPVPNVRLAQRPSAVPYYAPAASSVWSAAPADDYQLLKALLELSAMCATTSDCDFMIGYAPMAWLGDIGLTSPRQAWYSMLVQDSYSYPFRFIVAHEAGHLYGFEHDTRQGGSGYDVRRREDRRISTALMPPQTSKTLSIINSFMNVDPVESPPPERLWIEWQNYSALRAKLTSPSASRALQRATSSDPLLLATGIITPATGSVALDPWYQLEPGDWQTPTPGPYNLVFLDAAGEVIAGYTRPFSIATTLQPAGGDSWDLPPDAPAPFALKVPYPAAMARIQIRRTSDDALLAERTLSAGPPTVAITAPVSTTWSGSQPIAWQTDAGETRHYIVQVSTDGGATWEAQAIHWPSTVYTIETRSMPNTTQALIRVIATDGLNTASDTAGPFTVDNPSGVDYVSPTPGATHVNVAQPLYAGFHDPLDPTSVHSGTFTLSGGPYGAVPGMVTYDAEAGEATFIPKIRLAYSTTYTAHVSTAVRALDGTLLSEGATWRFTTEQDVSPPRPRLLSPPHGALHVPRNTVVAVAWDRALEAGALTPATFQMAEVHGAISGSGTISASGAVSGSVAYDAAAQTATFTPDALLAPRASYVVTLTAGITSTQGNATITPTVWYFGTGEATSDLAFTGSYADWGVDANGDGRYEQLVVRVGVQVTETGSYVLRGTLADVAGERIASAGITATLTIGAHFLDLAFDGAAIGGRGVDGPYSLTGLLLHRVVTSQTTTLTSTAQQDAYRTFAYPAGHFPSPLHFGGLPDVMVIPGTAALDACNVRDYARHMTLASDQLSYTVMLNTNPRMSVDLEPLGVVRVAPEQYWEGRTSITIRASDGVHTVQDTFEAAVGWPYTVYLPLVLRDYNSAVSTSRSAWITPLQNDFESTFGWSRYSFIDTTHQPEAQYQWDRRDCRAYSGQYSAWAFGGGDDGSQLACGANYPQAVYTLMYRAMPVNLKYVAQAEYSAKVWVNLNPGDEVCLRVAATGASSCLSEYGWPIISAADPGICHSGQTSGWESLTLDLADIPQFGSMLGEERVCMGVTFQSQYGETRPEGAYVDDVNLRICPEGLTEYCGGEPTTPPVPPLTAGNIGGYPEAVDEAALAVETTGRAHALWTGKLQPNLQKYVFYSSSPDGVTWTPYQILSTWGGREPQIAVDNVHGRVHLAYANDDGIVHHTVKDGNVSAPTVVAPPREYYLPGFSLPSGGVAWPSLTVAEATGYAYLVWEEGYYVKTDAYTHQFRHRSWCATWDGAAWSAPLRKINDLDTAYTAIAAAPDGQTMMAWFQRWVQSSGGGVGPGDPIVARTAYGTEPGRFPLRQATHDPYPEPQRDESILLAYSGGDDAFVLASDHLMWPGHSRVYRYVWQDGAWSEPLSVAENTSGWGVPRYIGAATDTPLIRYVYSDDWVLKTRTETNGVLSATQTIADYLSARGYSGTPLAYLADAAGDLHMVISGEKDGVAGFYYVQP